MGNHAPAWRVKASSHLPYGTVVTEHNKEAGIYRAVLETPVSDTSDNEHEAHRRLADRLEAIVRELRKTHGR
jgi:hypothetical protein